MSPSLLLLALPAAFLRTVGGRGGDLVGAAPLALAVVAAALVLGFVAGLAVRRRPRSSAPAPVRTGRMEELEGQIERLERAAAEGARQLAEASDRAEAAARAKAAFVANVSHEIRTPMNGVVGMAELLADSELSGEQRHMVGVVRSCAERLMRIIDDVLDFSALEADALVLRADDFDLGALTEQVAELLAPRVQGRPIELLVDVATDAAVHVVGDAARLEQVLVELLGNALKFTERGEVGLVVRALRADEREVEVSIVVRDTGAGIAAEHRARLFEAFEQDDPSSIRRFGGAGLGLALCQRLVRRMGGRIDVSSSPGEGSTFDVRLTLRKQPAAALPRRAVEVAGMRVLVVDDNATNRRILCERLQSWGCEPREVENPAKVVGIVRAASRAGRPFGLALLDFRMPRQNGRELARALRHDRTLGDAPILLLTSVADLPDPTELASDGITRALSKPVRAERLYEAVVDALGASEAASTAKPAVTRRALVVDGGEGELVVPLDRIGWQATVVDDAAEAVRCALEGRFDVLLLAREIEAGGQEVARAIREHEMRTRAARRLPIVAITDRAGALEREEWWACGADAVLARPLAVEGLEACLERWTRGSSVLRATT